MNKLKKNIEGNAFIFALGGMDINIASALLVMNDNRFLGITGTNKKACKEKIWSGWSAKYMLWNVFTAVAIIILLPVFFITSVFNLASLIRSGLNNNDRSGNNASGSHKIKIDNILHNVTARRNKFLNTDRSNFPGTNSARNNITKTGNNEILKFFDTGKNGSLFAEKGKTFSDKAALYERMQFEIILVKPVRIVAWHISPEGIMLNRDNWVEMEIKNNDIRLLNKNAALFFKTFQHVLLTKVN